jgi:uncharacterized membrane protein YeaQ/YmgE (transglycosylase-associated protein family)
VISWIVWGLFVGIIARLLLPGRQRLGIALTIVFGVAGSIIGGLVATELLEIDDTGDFGFGSFIIAVGTSVGLLAIYQAVAPGERKRDEREKPAG